MNGFPVSSDEIPTEVVRVTCEAAAREIALPGLLNRDVTPRQGEETCTGGGAVEVEYAVDSSSVSSQQSISPVIDGILATPIGISQAFTAAIELLSEFKQGCPTPPLRHDAWPERMGPAG